MNQELDNLIRQEFGLGKAESPQSIYHIRDPRLPQFEFEWHVGNQRIYRIDIPGQWVDEEFIRSCIQAKGHCIAEHCLTHAMAYGFVQTFCRGYLLALTHAYQGVLQSYAPERIQATDSCPVR